MKTELRLGKKKNSLSLPPTDSTRVPLGDVEGKRSNTFYQGQKERGPGFTPLRCDIRNCYSGEGKCAWAKRKGGLKTHLPERGSQTGLQRCVVKLWEGGPGSTAGREGNSNMNRAQTGGGAILSTVCEYRLFIHEKWRKLDLTRKQGRNR